MLFLDFVYVGCLWSLITFGYVESDFLALLESPEAALFDCAMMNEYLVSIIGGDKTKTFLIIEPLHCSICHDNTLLFESPRLAKPGSCFCISENNKDINSGILISGRLFFRHLS